MKILLVNQAFYPDVVSTAQHLTDLAVGLAAAGHEVAVLCSDRGYDDPSKRYPKAGTHRGVSVRRVSCLSPGKKSMLARAINFASFHTSLFFALCRTPRQDVVVALTSPPLVAVQAVLFCRWKGGRVVYWLMDLNPDEALAAGWLKEGSLAARALKAMNRWCLKRSHRMIALDRQMCDRVIGVYGADPGKVRVLPPWAHDDYLRPVDRQSNPFRKKHGLDGKFVVMYSGNHSPCHPLDTLLEAARLLAGDPGTVFLFIGGGSLTADVRAFKQRHGLANILQLPYQPIESLSESLSAADLHVTVMGGAFAGIVHPCKIYGILAVGKPFLYIGPKESFIGELMERHGLGFHAGHGEAGRVIEHIGRVRGMTADELRRMAERSLAAKSAEGDRGTLLPRMMEAVVS
ncbi:MAG: hypothetical protein A3D28_02890 [Omnitrophica bacterium RIFCSPHIGHO2_02_FULL_63_14]|nr:MAG: hypothetical protein A3D28_02890 [Omnitrophica bacterium RIFCSPHIGHO2_02_FULL_63_14]